MKARKPKTTVEPDRGFKAADEAHETKTARDAPRNGAQKKATSTRKSLLPTREQTKNAGEECDDQNWNQLNHPMP